MPLTSSPAILYSRASTVEAYQFMDLSQAEDLAEWCGGEYVHIPRFLWRPPQDYILVKHPYGKFRAELENWIVHDQSGSFHVMSDAAVHSRYGTIWN